jgi:hypothetical protein
MGKSAGPLVDSWRFWVLRVRLRVCGLKRQKEKRNMDHFAGLDVSVKETSICIVDDTGKFVREMKVPSEPAPPSTASIQS